MSEQLSRTPRRLTVGVAVVRHGRPVLSGDRIADGPVVTSRISSHQQVLSSDQPTSPRQPRVSGASVAKTRASGVTATGGTQYPAVLRLLVSSSCVCYCSSAPEGQHAVTGYRDMMASKRRYVPRPMTALNKQELKLQRQPLVCRVYNHHVQTPIYSM